VGRERETYTSTVLLRLTVLYDQMHLPLASLSTSLPAYSRMQVTDTLVDPLVDVSRPFTLSLSSLS
jgi:hypothetical protein